MDQQDESPDAEELAALGKLYEAFPHLAQPTPRKDRKKTRSLAWNRDLTRPLDGFEKVLGRTMDTWDLADWCSVAVDLAMQLQKLEDRKPGRRPKDDESSEDAIARLAFDVSQHPEKTQRESVEQAQRRAIKREGLGEHRITKKRTETLSKRLREHAKKRTKPP